MTQRNGEWGLRQFKTFSLSCSFLLMLFPSSAWILSMGYSPSGMDCSSISPLWVAIPNRKPAPAWAPWRLQLPLGHIHLLECGFSTGRSMEICSGISSTDCMRTTCFIIVFSTGCREFSALAPGAPLPLHLPELWYLPGCFTWFYSFLLAAAVQCFNPFLNMLSQRCHQHCWWAVLCIAASVLEPSGTGFVQ